VPVPDARTERGRQRIILKGDIPSPANPPSGCRFHTRCWLRERLGNPEICATEDPPLAPMPNGQLDQIVACHFATELLAAPVVADIVPDIEEEPEVVVPEGAPSAQVPVIETAAQATEAAEAEAAEAPEGEAPEAAEAAEPRVSPG